MGDQEDWLFLLEVVMRSTIMYSVALISLKLLGKRGVRQLSIFELVVIIGLGSAAGDPMFYQDVGLLPCIVVFLVIVLAYRGTTWLIGKSDKVERYIEGKSTCLIFHGMFAIDNFSKESLAQDEFFSELRQQSISHLGQVEQAILETSGNVSVFFYADNEVKYGLPILPDLFDNKISEVTKEDTYACSFCGNVQTLQPAARHHCRVCHRTTWVKAINKKRIT